MKFISGIKKIDTNQSLVEIKIPMYHRASIQFYSGSQIYYMTRNFISDNGIQCRELILTPLIPKSWHRMRKININCIDSPGVIHMITKSLRDMQINVNIQEALSTQIGAIYNLTLIVDFTEFIHIGNENAYNKIPLEAIEYVKQELLALIHPKTGKKIVANDHISINELTFLESISNVKENESTNHIAANRFRRSDNRITCTDKKINLLEDKTGESILKKLDLVDKEFYYTMFSDSEEKYIKIIFFDLSQTVAFIDVHHEDTYGAISEFTQILFEKHGFNIIASYSHQQMDKPIAHWYAIVDIGINKQKFYDETLRELENAKYGNSEDIKYTKNVFLIESTEISTIEDKTILRYGQNKKTIDGLETSVYKKKVALLTDRLSNNSDVKLFQQKQSLFLTANNLKFTQSLIDLIEATIDKKKKSSRNRIIKFISILVTIILIALLFFILYLVFGNKLTNLLSEALKKYLIIIFGTTLLLGAIFLTSKIEKLLHHKL